MSPKTSPCDSKPVRQAAAYAIDRDAIIQGILLGYAFVENFGVGTRK